MPQLASQAQQPAVVPPPCLVPRLVTANADLTATGAEARAAWLRALPKDPNALVSQTPAWMDCICASGRYVDASRAYRAADGHELVLPLARRRLAGRAGPVSSMPFGWGTGGLVSSRGWVSADDVAGVVADLERQLSILIAVRPSPATAEAWAVSVPDGAVRTPYMSQTVDLSGGFDEVWNGFAATVRSHCRKAGRRGVTAERDDTGRLMPVFDALYRTSVDRWASQQHEPRVIAHWRAIHRDPPEKFRAVAQRLGRACHVWVAWRAGEPIAALVVLAHGNHTTMWRAAMNKEAVRGTGATELLHQLAIEEACTSGRRFYHLGDSAPCSGVARHKRGYGATDASYAGYRLERLPVTAVDEFVRRQAKRVIGFRD
jgi:hypothetical protein